MIYNMQKMSTLNSLCLLAATLFLTACNGTSDNDPPYEGNSDLAEATWISVQKELPGIDSLLYEDDPSPIFRKEFTAKRDIRSATLFISSAGYYRATLNGERIGKNYLDPAWTNFEKRVYYSEYDLTAKPLSWGDTGKWIL